MAAPPQTRRVSLPPLHEFRFELEANEAISVTLLQGRAEVFGSELVAGQAHPFGDELRAAVWTPDGAELEISKHETSYVGSESPIPSYLTLHLALARMRLMAKQSSFGTAGNQDLSVPDDEISAPRIMLVGERGSGKSTLIKMLTNWRIRESWAKHGAKGAAVDSSGLVFVNLDVQEGAMTMPGTISIAHMKSMLTTTTPVSPFGTAISSGPPVPFPTPTNATEWRPSASVDAYAPTVNPLVFWYGHDATNENPDLYDKLLKEAGRCLKRKLEENGTETWKGGCIIDTPGQWAEKKSMSYIPKAVRALEANIVLVVGSQRLEDQVKRLLETNKTVTVVRVPPSNGASEADDSLAKRVKDAQIRSYFYGGPALTAGVLSPFSIIVKFDDLKIFRVGESSETMAPDSALPIGAGRTVSATDLVSIDLTDSKTSSILVGQILAIPQAADDMSDDSIVASPVLGFVFCSALDQIKKKVTLLSPLPGRLPRKTLLLGSLEWQDS
ncbi:Cleavage polyadenylation factor subunit clp1 [Microbotryomycetes sp. JL221]|nr:Cleavage polyadenylation factor subunit clp1 [Microbotryomycetes sp. JL221]